MTTPAPKATGPRTRIDYIHDMSECLAKMAAADGFEFLSYLLMLVVLEARGGMQTPAADETEAGPLASAAAPSPGPPVRRSHASSRKRLAPL